MVQEISISLLIETQTTIKQSCIVCVHQSISCIHVQPLCLSIHPSSTLFWRYCWVRQTRSEQTVWSHCKVKDRGRRGSAIDTVISFTGRLTDINENPHSVYKQGHSEECVIISSLKVPSSVSVCVCVWVSEWVSEWVREREREWECVCVRERERECVWERERERVCERESVCVRECVRERVCVRERERERVCERESVCVRECVSESEQACMRVSVCVVLPEITRLSSDTRFDVRSAVRCVFTCFYSLWCSLWSSVSFSSHFWSNVKRKMVLMEKNVHQITK